MGSVTLRPNVTLRSAGYTNPHLTLGDNSDATGIAVPYYPSDPGCIQLGFTDATGTIPAGRQIITIQFWQRGARGDGSMFGFGNYASQWLESSNVEIYWISGPVGTPAATVNTASPVFATDGNGVPWTFSKVDGIKANVGSEFGAGQSPPETYDVWMVVTYTEPPAAPTSVTPASGSTVTVPNPVLGGTMAAISTGQSQKMEWQLATDSGFTTNVKTVTEPSSDFRSSGATTQAPSTASLYLTNGTWYIRARAIDQYGLAGPYSAGTSFTVNVPVPTTPTLVTPAAGSTVTTMTPTLGATLGADSAGRLQRAEWTLATNSTFTANARTITELTSDNRASGATTQLVPSSLKITSNLGTTWYIRARAITADGATSAWTAAQSFTLAMAAPPAPTGITPATGSTVTTNTPTLGATLGAASEGRTSKAEWQLATDSGFTANVRVVTEPASNLRTSGATTEVIPTANDLFQTLWYVRARAIDQYGQAGAYSAAQTFTVTHAPVGSPSYPGDNITIPYAGDLTFTWGFSDPDPNDQSTAYQMVIERNDTGAVILDSNKVLSSLHNAVVPAGALPKDVLLRWKIRVWDTDAVTGGYSPYQLFSRSDPPTVTITAPSSGGTVTTGQPTVTWTNDASTVQVSRRIYFTRTSDGAVIYDTGVVNTASTSFTAPYTILENGKSYSVTVSVTDNVSMTGSDTNSFSVTYTAPDTVDFNVSGAVYDAHGYMLIDWSQMTPDAFFVDWRVYRRLQDGASWELLATFTDSSTDAYRDWTATTGDTFEYAVTQSGSRSGLILESAIVPSDPILANGSHYWLINPLNDADNLKIDHVKSDQFSDDYEEEQFIVIGRGRKVNHGTRYGYSGTLTAEFRDTADSTARQKRLKLQTIKAARTGYYLRNPFGDVLQVALGNISISRVAGVGVSEFVDVEIPYMEVF